MVVIHDNNEVESGEFLYEIHITMNPFTIPTIVNFVHTFKCLSMYKSPSK